MGDVVATEKDLASRVFFLHKWQNFRIRYLPLAWFKDYLVNRKQCLTFKNTNSSVSVVTCGLPQGSFLKLLLFLMYIINLPNIPHCAIKCILLLMIGEHMSPIKILMSLSKTLMVI